MALQDDAGHHAVMFFLAITVIAMVLIGYMVLEKTPLEYENLPFRMAKETFSSGEIPSYWVVRCNSSDDTIVYTVDQSVERVNEDFKIKIGSTKVILNPGCNSAYMMIAPLPKNLLPGYYRIIGESEVPGTVRTHFVEWYTTPFEVK